MTISKIFSKLVSIRLQQLLSLGLLVGIVLAPISTVESAQPGTLNEAASFDCSTVSDVPTSECEALVALYNNTNGDSWEINANWLASINVSDWYGIAVSGGYVTEIRLNNNQLTGSIPSQLGDLSQLEILDFTFNNLNGGIPQHIEDLSKIRELSVSFNELTGGIPTWLGSLTTLEKLGLGENPLGGEIPSELGNLINLTALMLFGTEITGSIPSEFGQLDNLIHLHLNVNNLNGIIPPELGDMDSIEHLWMGQNQLEGSIPSELGDLTGIRTLFLEENQLSGDIPDSLTNLTSLCRPGLCDDIGMDYGLSLGYNYLNTTGLSTALSDYLAEYDPDWQSTQAVEETITGSIGGTLTSSDGNTEISIPVDAVEGEVTFTFVPQLPMDLPNVYSNNSFELTAQDSMEDPVIIFSEPLIITLHYDEEDLKGGFEQDLILYYFDQGENQWLDVVTTCDGGVYIRNLEDNWLSVSVCHLSDFALFGKSVSDYYLPLIIK